MAPRPKTEAEWWAQLLPPNERGCRLWPRKGDPYGKSFWRGEALMAHQVAFLLANGWLPRGRGVVLRHTCDTPLCCEPTHLLAGSQRENALDREERGRGRPRRGSASPWAKFTDEQVREIRARHAAGESYPSLGRAFGMHPQNIGRICRREGYVDVE